MLSLYEKIGIKKPSKQVRSGLSVTEKKDPRAAMPRAPRDSNASKTIQFGLSMVP